LFTINLMVLVYLIKLVTDKARQTVKARKKH